MIEVGDCSEDVEAYIVEEQAKLQVVIEKSKTEVSTGSVSGSLVFYDKLQSTVKSQIETVKSSVKESYVEGAKGSHKIDVSSCKHKFTEAVSVHLVEAKTEVYKKDTVEVKKHTETGHIETIVGGVITGVIAGEKNSTSKIEVVKKDSENVIVGVVSEDKKVGSADIEIVKKHTSSGHVEAIAGGVVAGIVTGHKDTTKVDVVSKESEVVSVGIISADKKTEAAKVDVVTKDSEVVSVGVVADQKKTESTKVETVKKDSETRQGWCYRRGKEIYFHRC